LWQPLGKEGKEGENKGKNPCRGPEKKTSKKRTRASSNYPENRRIEGCLIADADGESPRNDRRDRNAGAKEENLVLNNAIKMG